MPYLGQCEMTRVHDAETASRCALWHGCEPTITSPSRAAEWKPRDGCHDPHVVALFESVGDTVFDEDAVSGLRGVRIQARYNQNLQIRAPPLPRQYLDRTNTVQVSA